MSQVHSESSPNYLDFTVKRWHREFKEWKQLKSGKKGKKKWARGQLPERFLWKMKDKSKYQHMRHIIGIDTETYESNGNILCLCTSQGRNDYIIGTPYQRLSLVRIYDFLARYPHKPLFVAWNLKFDATAIIKGLASHEQLIEFKIKSENVDDEDQEYYLETEEIVLKYLPKKMLSIYNKETKNKIEIFDALQFYGSSLDKAAKDYKQQLEMKGVVFGKEYKGKYTTKRFPDNITIDEPDEVKKILEYCYKDCVLAAKLVEIWLESYYKNFGFYPDKLYSTGYITALYVQTKLSEMFMFGDAPIEVQDAAYQSYAGGRFEDAERGFFENIWHNDINSAYPFAMVEAPDFKRGKWLHIKDLQTYTQYSKNIGFYKIAVTVNENKIAPFWFRDHDGSVFFPKGTFITNTTSMELEQALKHYNIEIHKIDGFCFIPKVKDKTEFSLLVQEMYDTRQKFSKDDPVEAVQNFVYKVLINSLYGKFAQHKPEPRGFFNPVMASYITGKCRAMLLEAAAQSKENIIGFATDSIFSKKKLNLPIGNKLGEWDEVKHDTMTLLMPGIYQYSQKDDEDYTKTRGFGKRVFTGEKQESETQFTITGFELTKEGDELIYKFNIMRPVSISEAVIQHKYNIDDLCKMEMHQKKVSINGDRKRLWENQLSTIKDHNFSEPLNISWLTKR